MDKATLERLTQLTLAAQGQKTKRPLHEIIGSEKMAAEKYMPPVPPTTTGKELTEQTGIE